jgi:hypothetical protein
MTCLLDSRNRALRFRTLIHHFANNEEARAARTIGGLTTQMG